MVLGKGGCDSSSPGIGDVAFVKNLMTERIVTRSFRCSKFGLAHSPESMIGWVCYCMGLGPLNVCFYSFAISHLS
jgi:hypothetical protein